MTDSESLEGLIGQTFPQALAGAHSFAEAGAVRILVTRPPHGSLGLGRLRVVAARGTPDGVCLVLCYQSYRKLPAANRTT